MKSTRQSLFFQFQNKNLSEIPSLAINLLNSGKEILLLVARRANQDDDKKQLEAYNENENK